MEEEKCNYSKEELVLSALQPLHSRQSIPTITRDNYEQYAVSLKAMMDDTGTVENTTVTNVV